jgi:hypothetical protein
LKVGFLRRNIGTGKQGPCVYRGAQKKARRNAVKPLGNSKKGIGTARLTWLMAWDKYARY